MLIPNLVLAGTLAGSKDWCSTPPPTAEFLSTLASLKATESTPQHLYSRQNTTLNATITVPVYMTAVVNTTDSDETLSEAVLKAQFDVIADRFAPYDITFTLESTSRVVDDDNAQGFDYSGFNGFKASHRKGDYGALNLYYVSNMGYENWGYGSCTLPTDPGSFFASLDGCTMRSHTVPGGEEDGKIYKGEITVHEIGHWFSLMHTFDGEDCDGPGDYIDDTPAESVWQLNVCPVGRDSCPDQPGLDPINNYMDYAGEGCWTEFTPGQKARMHNSYWTVRAPQGAARRRS
ncbi:hypothetical protein GQ53DRAFT_711301 [Thozetella sp. PMI_491]|nr:hypothetical protein GQ53DRAFT_711301 [Thozetella sp. PMI_491]